MLSVTRPPESTSREAPGPARDELDAKVAVLYSSLKELARRATRGRGSRQLISPTDLVHESYLRLARNHALGRLRRTEFLALAATVIRHVLVDRARELDHLERELQVRFGGVIAVRDLQWTLPGLPVGAGSAYVPRPSPSREAAILSVAVSPRQPGTHRGRLRGARSVRAGRRR